MIATTTSPRPLLVLNINDQDELTPAAYRGFLEVENANSVGKVQMILHKRRAGGADLFLVDIDMERGGHPAELNWGHPEFRAYGPLLALPFIGGPAAAAFVPYSGFWGNPGVTNNGFVQVALALILSQIHDRPFSFGDVGSYVRQSVTATDSAAGLVNEAEIALARALELYRKRISTDPRIQLIDVEPVIERLKDIEEQTRSRRRWPIAIPFSDAEGPLSLDICYGGGSRDRIQLSSLFGDILSFAPPADSISLEPVYSILDSWLERSVTCRGDTLYKSVLEVLELCVNGMPLNKAAKRSTFVKAGGNRYQVIRLAMEFAWVNARRTEPDPQKRVECVHRLLGLEKQRDKSNAYKRFLGESATNRVVPSERPWRTPFKQRLGRSPRVTG